MADAGRPELEIRPDPTGENTPFFVGALTIVGGTVASLVPGPNIIVRVALWGAIIWIASELYRTSVRRMTFGDDAAEVEFFHRRVRMPYARLEHVIVKAQLNQLRVTFVVRSPPAVIRTWTGLRWREALDVAPRLIRTLVIHGVSVRVPGRPDLES
jgi:hypothetical protein